MKHFTIACVFMAFFSMSALAQNVQDAPRAADGTYQIIVHPQKKTPVFAADLLVQIEAWRSETESKTVELQPGVIIIIPSRTAIYGLGYKTLEPIIYE
jgi:hypothetical protein